MSWQALAVFIVVVFIVFALIRRSGDKRADALGRGLGVGEGAGEGRLSELEDFSESLEGQEYFVEHDDENMIVWTPLEAIDDGFSIDFPEDIEDVEDKEMADIIRGLFARGAVYVDVGLESEYVLTVVPIDVVRSRYAGQEKSFAREVARDVVRLFRIASRGQAAKSQAD